MTADPALAAETAERARRTHGGEHHGSPSGRLSVHVEALRAAGFAEVGTIWQRGDNRLLCAVLGSCNPVVTQFTWLAACQIHRCII